MLKDTTRVSHQASFDPEDIVKQGQMAEGSVARGARQASFDEEAAGTTQDKDDMLARTAAVMAAADVSAAQKQSHRQHRAHGIGLDLHGDYIESMAGRLLQKIVLFLVVPLLTVGLVVTLIAIIMQRSGRDVFSASFLGLVGLSSASFLGCIFIIGNFFLHPELRSERRQQMMFSCLPGLVHYSCILHQSWAGGGCHRAVAVVDQVSFLMQMSWQVSVAHGVFRYIQFDKAAFEAREEGVRHLICWGLPVILTGILGAAFPTAYEDDVGRGPVRSPWCGISGDPSFRGVKALFVHAPQLIGVVAYGYFYYYIATRTTDSATDALDVIEARISTSPHQSLLSSSHAKRRLEMARATTTLRHCMAAFMMAYLVQTVICLYAEHFQRQGTAASELAYLARIYLVTLPPHHVGT
jgi:hypothetical protein